MMGLLLLSAFSGCGTRQSETAHTPNKPQAAAIAEIQRLGGKVKFDEEAAGKPVSTVGAEKGSELFLAEARSTRPDVTTKIVLTF